MTAKTESKGRCSLPFVQVIIAQISVQMNSYACIKMHLPRCLWKHLFVIGLGDDFLNLTRKAKQPKQKSTSGTMLNQRMPAQPREQQPTEWEKVAADHVSDESRVQSM